MILLTLYLVYPLIWSIYLSVMDAAGQKFVGLDNYTWMLGDDKFLESMRNNIPLAGRRSRLFPPSSACLPPP